jgi:hypothetical protein
MKGKNRIKATSIPLSLQRVFGFGSLVTRQMDLSDSPTLPLLNFCNTRAAFCEFALFNIDTVFLQKEIAIAKPLRC